MAQYAFRTIIALFAFLLFRYCLPLLLSVLGIALPGTAMQLIMICAAVIALYYIIWGRPVLA